MSNSDSRRDSGSRPVGAPEGQPTAAGTGRRDFLKFAGLTFVAVAVPEWLAACAFGTPTRSASVGSGLNVMVDPTNWRTVVRHDDLMHFRFNFAGMIISTPEGGTRQLVLADSTKPGVILIEFGPQHIVEPTVLEPVTGPPTTVPPLPIDARISGVSRLAFLVPAGTTVTIPYDLQGLLQAVTQLDLSVADNALAARDDTLPVPTTATQSSDPDQTLANLQASSQIRGQADVLSDLPPNFDLPSPTTPAPSATVPDSQTAIELPYRLILSPSQSLRFAHSATPFKPGTSIFTELWTSRLARSKGGVADETTRVPISVRAVSAPDLPVGGAGDGGADGGTIPTDMDPFPTMALTGVQRIQIVRETADFTTGKSTVPIHARRLHLSARGGSLDSAFEFKNDPPPFGLIDWQHRASFGRDNYVRVEEFGFLFPWGHETSMVIVSERKFLANPSGGTGPRTGYLWQRIFLVVRQPFIDCARELGMQFDGVPWAFQSVRIVTPSTPPLDPVPSPGTAPFLPMINGTPFRFSAQFTDWEGNVSKSDLGAIWIPGATQQSALPALKAQFEGASASVSDFNRQRVAYTFRDFNAPASTAGKTTFETRNLSFGAQLNDANEGAVLVGTSEGLSSFNPFIVTTEVAVAALRQFSGADQAMTMEYAPPFRADFATGLNSKGQNAGFDPVTNPGEAFLSLVQGSVPLTVDFGAQSQKGGGFLSPSMNVVGLSRQVGPIAGKLSAAGDVTDQIASFAQNAGGDPSVLFGALLQQTKLFGVFSLKDLFPASVLKSLPKFATQTLDTIGTVVRTVNQIQSTVTDLQNQATLVSSSWLSTVTTPLSQLETDFTNFLNLVSQLPPSNPTAFIDPTTGAPALLQSVATRIGTLQAAVSKARQINASRDPLNLLPQSQRLNDGAFVQADALLRQAAAMLLNGSALATEIGDALTAIAVASQTIGNLSSHFEWQTSPGDIGPIGIPGVFDDIFVPSNVNGVSTLLKIVAEVRAHDVAGKPAGLDLTATLNNFDVGLLGAGTNGTMNNGGVGNSSTTVGKNLAFLTLSFDHLRFTMMAGQKPDIDVGFSDLTFEGDLTFLNTLKSIIPLDGFGDPPGITVNANGIQGDFTVALPSLAVGVFTLENMNVGAGFRIPFIGDPMTVSFHFCERDNPFHLTVSMLGGGGYFLLDLSLAGVILVEAAIEFGAEASVNFVVASGSVLIMAGIYFRYTPKGVKLAGYVRIAGSLSVLGLITASVEMRLELSYDFPTKTAQGKATITIEVSIMFFSTSVDVSCQKSFGSCNADPTFADAMIGAPWTEYCAAFAA